MQVVQSQEAALQGSLLPYIDRPIDNTALQAYLTCPREYFLGMILHRRSKGKAPALVFGSAWHKAMEVHYLTDGAEAVVLSAVEDSWEGHDSVDDYRTAARIKLDYQKYLREKGKPSKESKKTLGWPQAPLVEMATNAMGNGLIHPWAGKLDRFIEISNLVYVQDHKTTSRLDKNYFKQYQLSYQMMGYTYLAQQLLPDRPVSGVDINLSHVLTNKTEFHSSLFTFNKEMIEEWIEITNGWLTRLNDDYKTLGELAVQYGELEAIPFDAVNRAFPPHYGDNGCSRKFGMCHYYPVCSISKRLRMKVLQNEFEVNPWNPLKEADE